MVKRSVVWLVGLLRGLIGSMFCFVLFWCVTVYRAAGVSAVFFCFFLSCAVFFFCVYSIIAFWKRISETAYDMGRGVDLACFFCIVRSFFTV